MADASFVQNGFIGEWSKRMQGRSDRPDYRKAMNVCLNGFPVETEAWVRRPGFAFAQLTRRGRAGKLIKFDFEQSAAYNMEFTDGALRFFVGGRLAQDTHANVVTISVDNPTRITLDADPAWTDGNEVIFSGLDTVCPTLQNRTFFVTKFSASPPVYSLSNTIDLSGVDGTNLVWVPGTPATLTRVITLSPPYFSGSWASLRSVQTELVAFLLQGSFAPQSVQVTTLPSATADATFNFAQVVFNDGPYLDLLDGTLTGSHIAYSGTSGSVTLTKSGPEFSAINFVSTDVGRLIRLFCEPSSWDGGANYATQGTMVKWNGAYWALQTVTSTPNQGAPGTVTNWVPVSGVALWTWATITAVNSTSQIVATINGAAIPTNSSPATFVIEVWQLGVYGGTNGFPTCGTYHEGRLWLSGAVPNRVDSSVANGIDTDNIIVNFAPTNADGSVSDSNAISVVFNAPDANPIFWGIPDLQGIIWGTKAGEWLLQPGSPGAMSPTNIAVRRVTKIGCANIEPRRTEHTIAFVQAFGRKVMEYFADVFSGKFTAPHLTFTCKHLTNGGIDQIEYQQELSPTVWMRVAGALRSITYKRDTLMTSSGPTMAAGAEHTLGSGRTVESLCVGPSSDGTLDSLSVITNDPATGIRHVEILTDILEEGDAYQDAWYLDDAVRPVSISSSGSAVTGAPYGGATLNGLWHLNGKTVSVYSGGLDCGTHAVASGSVFVPYGDGISAGTGGGLFTAASAAAAQAAGQIIVGFAYNSDGQLVRPVAPQETGARNGPATGKLRRVHKYALQVENSAGLAVGTDFAKLYPVLFKDFAGRALATNATFTGVYRGDLRDDYSLDGMFCWRVTGPYPANIVAAGNFVHTADQ